MTFRCTFVCVDDMKFGHFGVKIAKAEGNYHSDLLEPLDILDEDGKYTFRLWPSKKKHCIFRISSVIRLHGHDDTSTILLDAGSHAATDQIAHR